MSLDTPTRSTAPRTRRGVPMYVLAIAIVATAAAVAIPGAIVWNAASAASTAELDELQSQVDELRRDLDSSESERTSLEAELTDTAAQLDKVTADVDPVVLEIDFPMPEGYPQLVDLSTVPEFMQSSLDTGTGQAVAVAEGLWAKYPPGATVESAVNARNFDGYCASKVAFETEYLDGEPVSGSCW